MSQKINVHDVKTALSDERFRRSLPPELSDDVAKFLQNKNCSCNHKIYLNVMKVAKKQLLDYFPNAEEITEVNIEKEIDRLSKNQWQVINCHINDLTEELRKLGPGRKQIDMSRWEDQVTVIINHLEGVY